MGLGELDQHASGGAWVQERHPTSLGSDPRTGWEYIGPRSASSAERLVHVAHNDANVMETRASARQEGCDGRILPGGLEKLDASGSGAEER